VVLEKEKKGEKEREEEKGGHIFWAWFAQLIDPALRAFPCWSFDGGKEEKEGGKGKKKRGEGDLKAVIDSAARTGPQCEIDV